MNLSQFMRTRVRMLHASKPFFFVHLGAGLANKLVWSKGKTLAFGARKIKQDIWNAKEARKRERWRLKKERASGKTISV